MSYFDSTEKQLIDKAFKALNAHKRAIVLQAEAKAEGNYSDMAKLQAESLENLLLLELNLRRIQSHMRNVCDNQLNQREGV